MNKLSVGRCLGDPWGWHQGWRPQPGCLFDVVYAMVHSTSITFIIRASALRKDHSQAEHVGGEQPPCAKWGRRTGRGGSGGVCCARLGWRLVVVVVVRHKRCGCRCLGSGGALLRMVADPRPILHSSAYPHGLCLCVCRQAKEDAGDGEAEALNLHVRALCVPTSRDYRKPRSFFVSFGRSRARTHHPCSCAAAAAVALAVQQLTEFPCRALPCSLRRTLSPRTRMTSTAAPTC